MTDSILSSLVAMSNRYGADPAYVLAGGGNTSVKEGDVIAVKGSGCALASAKAENFVKLDRAALEALWDKKYSQDEKTREAEVLSDLLAARLPGEDKRPSVETLLHAMLPRTFVLHVHPSAVNALTCSKEGEQKAKELFPAALWIPEEKPGYILSLLCRKRIAAYKEQHGSCPDILILQNHGIFFSADTVEGIDALVKETDAKLQSVTLDNTVSDVSAAVAAAPALRMHYAKAASAEVATVLFAAAAAPFAADEKAFMPLCTPATPDHIVYCGANPLFLDSLDNASEKILAHKEKFGALPRIIGLAGVGVFVCGLTVKEASTALSLLNDMIKIIRGAALYGGYSPMGDKLADFIKNWEAESYRSKANASAVSGRLQGKIVLVTGAAQGFGKGIAEQLADEGANLVIADMNAEGAAATAEDFCNRYGVGRAIAVTANVSDEESVKAMVDATVLGFGGLDVLISNAGIVRSGPLEEMTKANFDLVTAVNYTAYFLCVKYACIPMKIQRSVCPDAVFDIISVNSKSGLSGSNKNFAYAGSKFGGIGLTQSFALELAPHGIKCNAVCPGNFLDGPLWSDPDRGLFVQYLNAGKVPGAKTIEDVRKFYESKVPLGRGCLPRDVALAILYAIEQKYETGQAIPVTGGQEMLK